ncbi:hypothetical protein GN958_ATG03865 [Phytophthora infestans]|uniref:Uncharacterized protein n=1 Tax=Phytophthora infestans TaxID=4787 RepID=A0A8S9TXA6_PHYIN|nr:hypothetical protein GN958_ATG18667 [Phytophthora infestans]KAF4146978.1 hypothetical protein GN958_ATG03865 [Phytophthora infestans]
MPLRFAMRLDVKVDELKVFVAAMLALGLDFGEVLHHLARFKCMRAINTFIAACGFCAHCAAAARHAERFAVAAGSLPSLNLSLCLGLRHRSCLLLCCWFCVLNPFCRRMLCSPRGRSEWRSNSRRTVCCIVLHGATECGMCSGVQSVEFKGNQAIFNAL